MSTGILVVEDSLTQAEQLRFLLEENGYAVRVARDGAEGLAMARERRPDLVISDVIMPRMDGFSMCRVMRSDTVLRDIPVVLLTSYASASNIVRGLECGAHNFLRKPYDADYLIQRVHYLVEKLKRRDDLPGPEGFRLHLGEGDEGLNPDREQILDLLVSTYEQAVRLNAELERQRDALTQWQARLAAVHEVVVAMNGARSTPALLETTAEKLLFFPGVEGIRIETLEPARTVTRNASPAAASAGQSGLATGFPLQIGSRKRGSLTITFRPDVELDWSNRMLLGDMCHQFTIALERLVLLESLDQRVLERTRELEEEMQNRRRSEQQRDASEQRYRLLFERSLAGIVQFTPGGEVIDCNPAFVRMAGYGDASELRGQSVTWFWKRPEDHRRLVQQLLQEGEVSGTGADLRRRDGSCCPVLASATLSEIEGPSGVIEMTLVDLTEYKSLEAQLQQAQKMESLGLLAGGIAHDFNNLLGVILAYCEPLRRHLEQEEEQRAKVEGISSVALRAGELTRQLFAFSRRQVMVSRPIDLNGIITRDLSLFQRLLGEHIRVTVHPMEGLRRVQGDPSQIDQVLLNLVVNARDAMPGGGSLTIATRMAEFDGRNLPVAAHAAPGCFAVMDVTDSGCGMDPAVASRVFDPFFTTKGEQGTGLGLSTVHGIVVQSGGFIQLESRVGEGTCFSIFFPCLEEAAGKPPSAVSVTGPVRILLVEDDEDLREMIGENLRREGYQVFSCSRADAGLEHCRNMDGPLHLLITDVHLPGMDGVTLAHEARLLRPDMRMLLMSGDPATEATARAPDLFHACLQKPFDRRGLLDCVQRLVTGEGAGAAAS